MLRQYGQNFWGSNPDRCVDIFLFITTYTKIYLVGDLVFWMYLV
jgi:hypothetical protein